MVVRYFVLLLMLIIQPWAQANSLDSELAVSISKTDKQLGQYLRVTLRYRGIQSLENINLDSWRRLAAISFEDEYSDKDELGRTIQVAQLRLYPRNTGRYPLPALQLGAAYSKAVSINISQPVVKQSVIKLDWEISSLSPWQREAVVIRVHLQTSDYTAHVKLDPPAQAANGQFISRALQTERFKLANGEYQHAAGWILYPMQAGSLRVDLPPVRYRLSGSDRRRFYLPVQQLQVEALPTYLPPTLPVGKLDLASQVETQENDQLDKAHWKINIKSHALIPYGVPDLDKQLAAMSHYDIANIKIQHRQFSSYSEFGDRSLYSSPLPDWLMPFGKNLSLSLRYFNPQTGRLEEITHKLPRSWQMPDWAWWITRVLALIIGVFLFKNRQPWVQQQINRLILRRQLRSATSIKQLRQLILAHGQYITLSDWAKNHPARKPVIQKLNDCCFASSNGTDVQTLKSEILKVS